MCSTGDIVWCGVWGQGGVWGRKGGRGRETVTWALSLSSLLTVQAWISHWGVAIIVFNTSHMLHWLVNTLSLLHMQLSLCWYEKSIGPTYIHTCDSDRINLLQLLVESDGNTSLGCLLPCHNSCCDVCVYLLLWCWRHVCFVLSTRGARPLYYCIRQDSMMCTGN